MHSICPFMTNLSCPSVRNGAQGEAIQTDCVFSEVSLWSGLEVYFLEKRSSLEGESVPHRNRSLKVC